MKRKYTLTLASLTLALMANAQSSPTVYQSIDFETTTWKRLGVYDSWEASPFRTGRLEGKVAVVDNPYKALLNPLTGQAFNPSNKVLALQRSRFASNTFGARIDLNTPIALQRDNKYAHVLINSPKQGRVMVMGLGKRDDRSGQSPEVEQFWSVGTGGEAGQWKEVVVPLAGNNGISIYSLVVVPDLESPHNLTQDFVAYIDQIIIDNQQTPYIKSDYYYTAFEKTQTYTRSDRQISSVSVSNGTSTQTATTSGNLVLQELAQDFWVKAGETLTPSIAYSGSWMNGYLYLDTANKGVFERTDLVSYSYLDGTDSKGNSVASGNSVANGKIALPSFKVPAGLANGMYRIRFKVDWNSNDPLGNTSSDNSILNNGGGFVDLQLNVHGTEATVSDNQLNGEVLAADGTKLNSLRVPFGEGFKIRMAPENGFEYSGIRVKHGYNLSGDSIVRGVQQWRTEVFSRSLFNPDDNTFTIPARCINGEVLIEGFMVEQGKYTPPPTLFQTTRVKDGALVEPITWYNLQIGNEGYVLTANGTNAMALTSTTPSPSNLRQQWAFVGNDQLGYQIYNRATGATTLLAAPTTMSNSNAGGTSYVTMRSATALPTGYTDRWHFTASNQLSGGQAGFFMYEDGLPNNKVNNRDSKLAFWTGGADAGSTLRISISYVQPVGINTAKTSFTNGDSYTLDGRHALTDQHGIVLQKGKKLLR